MSQGEKRCERDMNMTEKTNVLIVASDEAVRDRIVALFSDEYAYLSATRMGDALRIAKEKEAASIVIYSQTDEPDIFEAIRRIKSDPSTELLPLVFISEENVDEHRQALGAGADIFLNFAYEPSLSRLLLRNAVSKYVSQVLLPNKQLDYEKMINKCLRVLYGREFTDDTLGEILRISADYMNSERAYIFRRHENSLVFSTEYCAPGIPPQIDELRCVDLSVMRYYEELIGQDCYICFDDVEELKDRSPVLYERLRSQGIRRMTLMLLRTDGVLQGTIGYDNPTIPVESLRAYSENVFLFLTLAAEKREREKKLYFATYHDDLTGVLNRHCFRKDISDLSKLNMHEAGILYFDLNGLKQVNDHQSHKAGDRLLIRCADMIRTVCQTQMVYRMGGDEFVAVMPDIDEETFMQLYTEAKAAFGPDSLCSAAIGVAYWREGEDFEAKVIRADHAMYEDKVLFYRQTGKDRRRRKD